MNQQRGNGNQTSSPTGYSQAMPPTQQAPPVSSHNGPNTDSAPNGSEKQVKSDSKFFFQPKYAKLGVKGNFMPLAAKPANVDLADWLAHQSMSRQAEPTFFALLMACSCRELSLGINDCTVYPGNRYKYWKASLQSRKLPHNDCRLVSPCHALS